MPFFLLRVQMNYQEFQNLLRKYPVNFFPAFYPVENYCRIISDFTADAVLSDADAIIILKAFHPVNVKIGEKIPRCRDFIKYEPFDPGPVAPWKCSKIF